jgi:hypothetical protein
MVCRLPTCGEISCVAVTAVSLGARKINAFAQRSLGDKRNGRLGLFGVNQKHLVLVQT